MAINTEFKQEIYKAYEHTGLVMDALAYLEKEEYLECRAILGQIIDEYRDKNPLDTFIYSGEEVERHNTIVGKLLEMERLYSTLMIHLEEYELLRQ